MRITPPNISPSRINISPSRLIVDIMHDDTRMDVQNIRKSEGGSKIQLFETTTKNLNYRRPPHLVNEARMPLVRVKTPSVTRILKKEAGGEGIDAENGLGKQEKLGLR